MSPAGLHSVPGARAMASDQTPEAHRCQQVVRQFHWPSLAHVDPETMVGTASWATGAANGTCASPWSLAVSPPFSVEARAQFGKNPRKKKRRPRKLKSCLQSAMLFVRFGRRVSFLAVVPSSFACRLGVRGGGKEGRGGCVERS